MRNAAQTSGLHGPATLPSRRTILLGSAALVAVSWAAVIGSMIA
ncbi:hypothetical protein [Zavarzinia sp. CC-PAN008]